MPAACALGMISGKIIFYFEIAERLRTLRYLIFTRGHLRILPSRLRRQIPFLSLRDIFPRSGGSRPLGWGLWHGGKVSGSGTKFADTPEAPSPRELSKPSGFD